MTRSTLALLFAALCACIGVPATAIAGPLVMGSPTGPTWASISVRELGQPGGIRADAEAASPQLTASVVPPNDEWVTYWVAGAPTGTLAIEGIIHNRAAVAYTNIAVNVTFLDASSRPMWTSSAPGNAHLLAPGETTTCSWTGIAPAGYDRIVWNVTGQPAKPGAVAYQHAVTGTVFVGAEGSRHVTGTVTNNTSVTVAAMLPDGWEKQGLSSTDATYTHTFVPSTSAPSLLPAVIPPGGSLPFDVVGRGFDDLNPATSWYTQLSFRSVGYSPRRVYRFFRPGNGTHFYTASEDEMRWVSGALGHIYRYEGVAYTINGASPSNMQPLYRFYRPGTGTHFYTASDAEMHYVMTNLGHLYAYEGPAYNVSTYPHLGRTVYRFFRPGNGTHFYTASEEERNTVMATLGHVYAYEGVAFYLAY